MTSKNLDIDQIVKSISDELERNKLNRRYGTSIDESMSYQQTKDVRNKINILISEISKTKFQKIIFKNIIIKQNQNIIGENMILMKIIKIKFLL